MFTPYKHEELNKLRMQIFIESLKLHKLLIARHKEEFKKILNIFTAFLLNPDKFTNDTYSMEDLFNIFSLLYRLHLQPFILLEHSLKI
jgi:hypothetical protein